MARKITVVLLCVLMLITIVSGCSNTAPKTDGSSTAVATEKKDLRFVIVPKVVHAWYDEAVKGANHQARFLEQQLGIKIEVEYIAPTSADITEQNSILEKAAATRPDGIALDPLDAVGNKAVIDSIKEQGIPVIVFDADSPDPSISNSSYDIIALAHALAARQIEAIGGKGKVAVMQGVPTAPNHQATYNAILDYLKDYPDITVIEGGVDNDDIQIAQQQASATIAANPDLDGYLCTNASGPIGIAAAIKEAGKIGQIKAIGINDLEPMLKAVEEGSLDSTIGVNPFMQGSTSLLMLWQLSQGMEIPATSYAGLYVITKDNVQEYLDALK